MARLTKRSYQRKAAAIGGSIFAGAALVATGFAAWVVSSTAVTPIDGGVTIGAINDKSIQLTANKDFEAFSFEPVENDEAGRLRWDGLNSECLGGNVYGVITPYSFVNRFTISMAIVNAETGAVDLDAMGRFEAAADKNYIVLPDVWNTEVVVPMVGRPAEENVADYSHHVAFAWGTHFGGRNPSEYYDEEGVTVADDTMKEDLADFYKTLTGDENADTESVGALFKTLNFRILVTADTSGEHTDQSV